MLPILPKTAVVLAGILIGSWLGLFAQQSASTDNAGKDKQLSMVAGNVVGSGADEPLRKARIVLKSEDDGDAAPYVTITDAEGHFTIERIRPGRYHMYAERDGYLKESYDEVLTLKPAQQVTNVLFRLQRCAVISGRVFDEDGDPAQGITVEALGRNTLRGKPNTYLARVAETNDLGEYRIFGLDAGRYVVRASPTRDSGEIIGGTLLASSIFKSAGGYSATYYPSVSEISRASMVELNAGDEVSRVDISLRRQKTYSVRGQVFNAVPNHFGGQTALELVPDDSSNLDAGHSGYANEGTGEFEIDDVPAGSYVLSAAWQNGERKFVGFGSTPVEVVNMSVDSVRVVITRGADIRGNVVVEGTGVVPSEIEVFFESKDAQHQGRARVKSDRTFLLEGMPDGQYGLDAWSRCEECYLKAAKADGQDILERGLLVSSGSAPVSIELVFSNKSGTIDGTVVRQDMSSASGAMAILVPEHPHGNRFTGYREASTDHDGRFVIKGVIPGAYHAYAWQTVDFENYTDPEFLRPFERDAKSVSIAEGEKKSLQLSLLPAPNQPH